MIRAVRIMLVLPLAYALAACAGGHQSAAESVPPMWADTIQQVLSDNPSAFERKALADSKVTDAEFREAQDLFRQCMTDKGWIVEFNAAGGYTVHAGPENPDQKNETLDADNDQCEKGTTGEIEPIYLGMKDNPHGLSNAELVRACFKKHNVPDGQDLSAAEFEKMLNEPNYRASTGPGRVCVADPTGSEGVTQEEADAPRVMLTPTFEPTNGPDQTTVTP